jgi:hypothetical protein
MHTGMSASLAQTVKAVEISSGISDLAKAIAAEAQNFELAGDHERAGRAELLAMRLALIGLHAQEVLDCA